MVALLLSGKVLASGARGPRLDSCVWREKFQCPNTLFLVSFAGMTLDKCIVESRPHHTKCVKKGTGSSLADTRIKGIVLGR